MANLPILGNITVDGTISKLDGTSLQFLKADGSIDSSNYSIVGHTHAFSSLTSKPTTLSGYGVTDNQYKTVYSYTNGCLVEFDIEVTNNVMCHFEIIGNSYGSTPIRIQGQFYNYTANSTLINYSVNKVSGNVNGLNLFHYNGKVYLWFSQISGNQSFSLFAWNSIGTNASNLYNRILSISNVVKPTTGITNEVLPSITSTYDTSTLVNPITGTGINSNIPRWTGTNTQGVGSFTDDGLGNIGLTGNGRQLVIQNNGGGTAPLYLQNTTAEGFSSISIKGGPNVSTTNIFQIGQYDNGKAFLFNQGLLPMGFFTNSLERLSVFGGGNVAIGTTTDNGVDKLQVNGSGSFNGSLKIKQGVINVNTSDNLFAIFGNYSGLGDNTALQLLKNGDQGDIYFQAFGSITAATRNIHFGKYSPSFASSETVMTINNSSSNVGIGTTTPAAKLDVNGNARFAVGSSTAGDVSGTISIGGDILRNIDGWYTTAIKSINTNSSPSLLNPRMGLFTQGAGTFLPSGLVERVSILANNGNVGIGTTSPIQKLEVVGGVKFNKGVIGTPNWSNNTLELRAEDGKTAVLEFHRIGNTSAQIYSDDGGIAFGTQSGIEQVRISQTGKLLVGTVTDNGVDKLQVNGGIRASSNSWFGANLLVNGYIDLSFGASNAVLKYTSGTMSMEANGGSIIKGAYNANTVIAPSRDDANNYGGVLIRGGGQDRMYVTPIGNVGIGTITPTSKLNIAGPLGNSVGTGGSTIVMTNTDTGDFAGISAGIVGITNAGMAFSVGGARTAAFSNLGNFMINTVTDNGVDKLQVNGSIKGIGSLTLGRTVSNFGGTLNLFHEGMSDGGLTNTIVGAVEFGMSPTTKMSAIRAISSAANWYTGRMGFFTGQMDSALVERMSIISSGNVLINTIVDNGIDKLQVNGSGSFTGTISALGGTSTNWNSAFSWGNHASAGYIKSYSETDTLQSVMARGNTTNASIYSSNTTLLVSQVNGLKSFIFHHPANDNFIIAPSTTINAQDWDWSKQFLFGGDGVFTVPGGNSTNWNSAFGWGNHTGLYSLLDHTHTFANIVSKPTTLSGYGITDTPWTSYLPLTGGTLSGLLQVNNNIKANIGKLDKLEIKSSDSNPDIAAAIATSKNITFSTGHIIEDTSNIIPPSNTSEGYGMVDMFTTISGAFTTNHIHAFQSRMKYTSSANMPTVNFSSISSFYSENQILGTGVVDKVIGLKVVNTYSPYANRLNKQYGVLIEEQLSGAINYGIWNDTRGNYFKGLSIGNTAIDSVNALNVTGSALFSSTIASINPYANFAALQTVGGIGYRWSLNNDSTFQLQRTINGFTTLTQSIVVNASDFVGIGTNNPTQKLHVVGNVLCSGTVAATSFFASSDMRLKTIVQHTNEAQEIESITYTWKDKSKGKKIQVGYSAQEVQKYMPDAVEEDSKGMLSVNYIQILVAKVAMLEKQLKQLQDAN